MSKRLTVLFLSVFSFLISFGQNDTLLKWNVSYKKLDSSSYELTATATVPQGWMLYGKNSLDEGVSAAFIFEYEKITAAGDIAYAGNASQKPDANFDNKQLRYYTGDVVLKQLVKINGAAPSSINGTVESFLLKEDELKSESFPFEITTGEQPQQNSILIPGLDLNNPLADFGDTGTRDKTLWGIFILGFIGGLIGLLTPCVFPMIPVTVSFFTKRSPDKKQGRKNAFLYGFFIFLIYILASIPFHLLRLDAEILNNIASNAWLNILFFVIFIVFAISFFGYFEITLPGSIANKADAKAGLTSVGGIFFMALTLVIVSFSCTGVILGSLLVGTLTEGAWPLTAGFAGFGLALALPFALFAIFPNWLANLPKSGSWLDTVKKVLAFIELAVALKFFSNADMVEHLGILKREIFIGLWILIGLGLAIYLFGKLKLPHDDRSQKIGPVRKLLAVVTLLFTLYLIPGLTNTKYANIRLLSGILPPLSYSVYGKENINGKGLEPDVKNDYDKALQIAKTQGKPLLLDFTGFTCTNCRRMEENVWTDPAVYDYIKQNFILVSLYVDDREKLPVEERTTYTAKDGHKKRIVTVGDKWATFEIENFNQSTQPLYVVIDNQERLVTHPVGYTPSISEYLEWLQKSKEAFDEAK